MAPDSGDATPNLDTEPSNGSDWPWERVENPDETPPQEGLEGDPLPEARKFRLPWRRKANAADEEAADETGEDGAVAARSGIAARFAGLGLKFPALPKLVASDPTRLVAAVVVGALGAYFFVGRSTDGPQNSALAGELAALRRDISALRGGGGGAKPEGETPSTSEAAASEHEATATTAPTKPLGHWSYGDIEEWGELGGGSQVCATGEEQSPIALESGDARRYATVTEFQYEPHQMSVVDNGHTIQVNANGAGAVRIDERTFRLVQFHVHAPSEHTIDGERFPLELHLVHRNSDDKLTVVAVMVRPGAALEGFDEILAAIGAPGTEHAVESAFDPTTLLPEQRDLFAYEGSLTTPPCTEGVEWRVMAEPITMSNAQIAAVKSHLHEANSRPLQPTNGREPSIEVDLGD